MRTLRPLVAAVVLTAGLAACGGDPHGVVTPATEVPAAAAASSESYTEFAQNQPAEDNTSEPLGLNLFAEAPTTETGSPVDFD